jgi:hypothetical protein
MFAAAGVFLTIPDEKKIGEKFESAAKTYRD